MELERREWLTKTVELAYPLARGFGFPSDQACLSSGGPHQFLVVLESSLDLHQVCHWRRIVLWIHVVNRLYCHAIVLWEWEPLTAQSQPLAEFQRFIIRRSAAEGKLI